MSLHWFTSFKVRVCNIIFLLLYILPHAHHQKFSFCPKITQVSHLPISPFYSCPLLTLCSYYSVLYISICLFLFSSVCSFIYVCFLYSTYEWNHIVFVFFVCLISQLRLMDSQGPSMLLQGQDFIPFYGWVVFHCVCVCVVLNFLKNLHTFFHSDCTNLQSRQQCMRVPFSSHPLHLLFLVFLTIVILIDVK